MECVELYSGSRTCPQERRSRYASQVLSDDFPRVAELLDVSVAVGQNGRLVSDDERNGIAFGINLITWYTDKTPRTPRCYNIIVPLPCQSSYQLQLRPRLLHLRSNNLPSPQPRTLQ